MSDIVKTSNPDKVRTGRAIACYMFPLVGLITYFNLKDENHDKAKKYGLISILGTATYASRIIYKKIKNGDI